MTVGRDKALLVAFFVICGLTIPFVFCPLSLGIDSIRMLNMALPAAMGGSFGQDQFPPFYPHLLCWLMKVGACNIIVLRSINYISLLLGYAILWMIFRELGIERRLSLYCLLAMALSTYRMQYMQSVGTDILLLPFAWSTIFMTIRLEGTQGVRKCIMLLSAMLLAAVSCSIRIAAAPLFLVIAGAACGIKTERIVQTLRSRKFWLYACAALIAGSSALVIVAKTTDLCASGGYLDDFMKQSKAWSFSTIIEIVGMHLKESIQLFYGRVPAPLIPYRYLFIIPLFSLLAYSL